MSLIPNELIEEFSKGNGCIFVGAGLSMGAGLPGWGELIQPLASEITDCPVDSSFLDIAQFYENEFGRKRLVDKLRDALKRYDARPTPVHTSLIQLPVQRIYTTNVDGIIELALQESRVPFARIVDSEDISSIDHSTMSVIKVHGDLEKPSSIVITAEDYESYFDDHPAIADLLKVDLQTRTVLFLGYRFGDMDLRMIAAQVNKESRKLRRNLFTIQFNPAEPTVRSLEHRGLRVISLQAEDSPGGATRALHAWLEEFARRLREIITRQPVPPAGKLPNNNLPPRSVEEFLGRKSEFARVMEGLKSRYPLITIEGFAGVGKTSLAVEVGHACAASRNEASPEIVFFEFVVWISAKDKPDQKFWMDDVLNSVATTTNFSAIRQFPEAEKKLQVERLLRTFRILLIVDNFETVEDPELTAWLEEIPEPSKVIITTREIQLHQKAWAVHLRGMKPGEAITLLRQHARQKGLTFIEQVQDDTLLALSNVTGGNPQAMKLALGLVGGGAVDLWQVTNQLHGSNPDQRIEVLFDELFARSWSLLPDHARKILLVTPLFFGVSSIRRDAIQAATGLPPYDFTDGLNRCVGFGLLEVDHEHRRFAIHPMTRAFARAQLNMRPEWEAERRRHCIEYFLDLVRKSVIREQPNVPYWNALVSDGMVAVDPEWPSILEVMKWADQEGDDALLVELVMLLVHYMDSRFYNQERLTYVKKAVAALKRTGRKEEEALLRIDALGWTCVEENRLDDAYEEITSGFQMAEELAKTDLLALGLAWRARVRIEQKESKRADKLIEDAQAIKCSPWIKLRVNMAAGDIALKQDDSEKALICYKQAESEANKYGGEGHGYQIAPRMGLAYWGIGDLDKAEEEFNRLSGIEQIAIGKLYAEYGLALVAYKRGKIQEARTLIHGVKAQISRRTASNLLLKLINSQEAKLPGLAEEFDGRKAKELMPELQERR